MCIGNSKVLVTQVWTRRESIGSRHAHPLTTWSLVLREKLQPEEGQNVFLKRARSSAMALLKRAKGISDEQVVFHSDFFKKLYHDIIWITESWNSSLLSPLHEILGKTWGLHIVCRWKQMFVTKKVGYRQLNYWYQLFAPPCNTIIYHPLCLSCDFSDHLVGKAHYTASLIWDLAMWCSLATS